MNEKLTKALGEELASKVAEVLKSANIEVAIANDGSYVPADKYEKLKSEHKNIVEQYELSQSSIKELESKTGDTEELNKQLKAINDDFEAFKSNASKREANFIKQTKLKDALRNKVNPDAIDLLESKFNLDELVLNEAGELVDIQSKIDNELQTRPTLKLNVNIDTPAPPVDKQNINETDLSKLSDAEYFALKRKGE